MSSLDPEAARRILRRAAEIDDHLTRSDFSTEATLRLAAAEVGIAGEAIDRAIAEEHLHRLLGLESNSRNGGLLSGPDAVVHTTVGPIDAMDRIDRWLRSVAMMRTANASEGVAVYDRRSDAVAVVNRSVRSFGGSETLDRPRRVVVAVVPIGGGAEGPRLVGVRADLRGERLATTAAASMVGAGGATTAVVLGVALSPWLLLIAPGALLVGAGLAASRRATLLSAQRHLEAAVHAALSRPAEGSGPAALLDRAVERVSLLASRSTRGGTTPMTPPGGRERSR